MGDARLVQSWSYRTVLLKQKPMLRMTITAILTTVLTVTTATQLIALELLPLLQERLDLYQVMMSVRALDFSWVKAKSYGKQSSSSMNSFSNLLFFFFFCFRN